MNNTIVYSIIYFLAISTLLGFNEIIYRIKKVKGEYTRKVAHIIAVMATLPLPYIFKNHLYILILALIFFTVLYISQNSKKLNSIHDINRKSVGSYLLPLSIYTTFCISAYAGTKLIYLLPMLILGISDPIAALVGMNVKKHNKPFPVVGRFLNKSIMGSLGFFASSFIISCLGLYVYFNGFSVSIIGISFAIAIAGTLGELFSWNGTDNLTIPLSVATVLFFSI